MRWYVLGSLAVACLVALSLTKSSSEAYVTAYPGQPDIDGILETVGLAIARWLADQIPIKAIGDLINAILDAWVVHDHKKHYWEHVEDNVKQTCGQFINQQNIDDVITYKSDVTRMLDIYKRSPVHGDGSYPSKNTQADAIHSSIVTNRYLVEAAEMPWSLSLHLVDIASVHLMILKDAAKSYSFPNSPPSAWWKDLSTEIAHYDDYTQSLHNVTVGFRQSKVACNIDWGVYHDTYTMTDQVTGRTDSCTQVHVRDAAEGSCAQACQQFQDETIKNYNSWFSTFVGKPVAAWRILKQEADKQVAQLVANS